MVKQIDELMRRRETLKNRLANFKTYLERNNDASKNELSVRLDALNAMFQDLLSVQDTIESKVADPAAEEEQRDEFESQMFSMQAAYKDRIEEKSRIVQPPVNIPNIQQAANIQPRRLQPLELPKFNGQVDNWFSFFDTFNSLINNDTHLDNIQKLHYLKGCLVGKASDVLDSIAVTGDNYNIAWETLTKRFSNKKIIVNHHMKRLFDQPLMSSDSFSELSNLLDSVKKHVKALKNYDVPIEHWDLVLIHLIRSKFAPETRKLWDASLKTDNLPTFGELEEFIESRCYVLGNEEPEKMSFTKKFSKNSKSSNNFSKSNKALESQNCCRLCKEKHFLFRCSKFLNLGPRERYSFIKDEKLCLRCFGANHSQSNCSRPFKCSFCSADHNSLLHFETDNENKSDAESNVSSHISNMSHNKVLLATATVIIKDNKGEFHKCRALLDSGSESNFITRCLADKLKLDLKKSYVQVSRISNANASAPFKVTCNISSPVDPFKRTIDCLVLSNISSPLPSTAINISGWHFLDNFTLADSLFAIPGKIDLLLGAELFEDICQSDVYKAGNSFPSLRKTVFGWTVIGKIDENSCCMVRTFNSRISTLELSHQLKQFWEIEEVKENLETGEHPCETIFKRSFSRLPNGRFVVELPFDPNQCNKSLGESRTVAKRRLLYMEKKMHFNPKFADEYKKVMREYIEMGHFEKVEVDQLKVNLSDCYYLPHHAVIKETRNTTKLRVVFDGSCKTTSGKSLNDILLNGPVIQDELFAILIRFRFYRIAFVSDIEKMYRMIHIADKHKNYQRVLWRFSAKKPISEYVCNRVMFGLKPSSFLATRVLNELSNENKEVCPRASEIIKRDCYIDNIVSGADNRNEAFGLQAQLINIMNSGGFNLRQWCSNDESLIKHLPKSLRDTNINFLDDNETVRTLGMVWRPKKDIFDFHSNIGSGQITKRCVVSEAAKIFDPLGLVSPLTIRAKMMIQILWTRKIEWDEDLPLDLLTLWSTFRSELSFFKDFRIPRSVSNHNSIPQYSLHAFSDASQQAYAAVIYIVCRTINGVTCNLLCSKTRVAPLKVLSIPRLELCGAHLSARLVRNLLEIVNVPLKGITFWCDSQIVLHWISTPPRNLKVFVSNRVSQIQEILMDIDHQWNYIRSKDNPADIASRGCSLSNLKINCLWWNGPHWLIQAQENWPKHEFSLKIDEKNLELKKMRPTVLVSTNELSILEKYSSFSKLLRVVAYCHLFVSKPRKGSINLSSFEYNLALMSIVKLHQNLYFGKEIASLSRKINISNKSKLLSLNPFLDAKCLLRVGGRLDNANLSYDRCHPYILHNKCNFTTILVMHYHVLYQHADVMLLRSILLRKYWIINSKNVIKKCVKQCMVCIRMCAKSRSQLMGNLPEERVNPSPAFAKCGVDYAGPFLIKNYKGRCNKLSKAYMSLFICFSTRAIHLELVSDLTKEAFIAALKRFIARRGKPSDIYCDNGRNFVGAKSHFETFRKFLQSDDFKSGVNQFLVSELITWHMIPAYTPHMGGLWEAGIKSVKTHLNKVLTEQRLTFEEFYTLLTEIEACLNSRPLTEISNDPSDLSPLTPGHFLIGRAITSLVEADLTEVKLGLVDRWKLLSKMTQLFWKRWSSEFLTRLQHRGKWFLEQKNLEIGELLLIKNESLSPRKWPLGRVVEVHRGNDGLVRVVTLRTLGGLIKRSIHNLCYLPLNLEKVSQGGEYVETVIE